MKIGRYGKIYSIGHRAMHGLLDKEVEVTEKIDGSQFSFGVIDGELWMRSKRSPLMPGCSGLFGPAVDTVVRIHEKSSVKLREGWIYRAEAVCKRKHNVITYDRVPFGGLILYGVEKGPKTGDYFSWHDMAYEATTLGIECVPLLFNGILTESKMNSLLDIQSILGGSKVEGIVAVRAHDPIFQEDGIPVRAKFVSPQFKERHAKTWGKPGKNIVDRIAERFSGEARWEKALQRLREEGRLLGEPRDIGPAVKAIQSDIFEEESEEISDMLMKEFSGQIKSRCVKGFAEWYKAKLAKEMFS